MLSPSHPTSRQERVPIQFLDSSHPGVRDPLLSDLQDEVASFLRASLMSQVAGDRSETLDGNASCGII